MLVVVDHWGCTTVLGSRTPTASPAMPSTRSTTSPEREPACSHSTPSLSRLPILGRVNDPNQSISPLQYRPPNSHSFDEFGVGALAANDNPADQ